MEKIKDKLENIKLEMLFMIVLLAIVIIAGISIFTIATNNKKIENFKDDASSLLSIAKNVYPALEKSGKNEYILTSEDGTSTAICITITGLYENDYLTKEYKDWNGYIVVEKQSNEFTYTLWGTNKKYTLDGYTLEELEEKEKPKKYNDEEFEREVTTSYTGATNKKYNGSCISKKVE